MKIVNLEEKKIAGISIRTTNANEFDPAKSKIGRLYDNFDAKVPVDYKNGARVYGVYYNYESDHSGEFSVLAGTDKITDAPEVTLEEISIAGGNYLVFEAKGNIPEVVIDAWSKIWDYFSGDTAQYTRAFTTDFELYKSQDEVEVHIAVV